MIVAHTCPAITYWLVYTKAQVLGYAFQIAIAATLISKRPITKIAALILLGSAALSAGIIDSQHTLSTYISALRWCDVACIMLLVSKLHGNHCTRVERGVAWGLAIAIGGHLLCTMLHSDTPGPVVRVVYQAVALAGLVVWWLTIRAQRQPHPWLAVS